MYQPVLDPVADSLGWSSLFAALPLLALFVLLGVLRMRAWVAALLSLLVAILVAVLVYPMPFDQALLAGTEGAVVRLLPDPLDRDQRDLDLQHDGGDRALRRPAPVVRSVSDDQRIQAIIIAFCFGALLEALAGFGTPVAITSVMLIALGFQPMKAAVLALVANTAPVAFGALATPDRHAVHGHRPPRGRPRRRWSAGRPRCWRCSCRWSWCSSSTASAASGTTWPAAAGLRRGVRGRAVRHVQLPLRPS